MPDLTLRTTFIVGYPGETEAEFQALLDFVQEIRFDRVGAFQFSFEPGTASEPLGDPIRNKLKRERWERLMALQQGISLEKNQSFVGKSLDVLVEGQGKIEGAIVGAGNGKKGGAERISLGRSYRDAPEIDGMVILPGHVPAGELVRARIDGALIYDLSGVIEFD